MARRLITMFPGNLAEFEAQTIHVRRVGSKLVTSGLVTDRRR